MKDFIKRLLPKIMPIIFWGGYAIFSSVVIIKLEKKIENLNNFIESQSSQETGE